MGNEVRLTHAKSLRSRVKGNFQARFWRAAALVRESLTLILNPTTKQTATMEVWGELLRRHWNYALGQRLDWLRRTRCPTDRCSLVSEPIGEIDEKVDYYSQAAQLKQTKELFPDY